MKSFLIIILTTLVYFATGQSGLGALSVSPHIFNADTDTIWWRSAIVYEITPHQFTIHPHYQDIEDRLPELVALGVNTIWLQPLFCSWEGDQGYDVTDYYHLRKEFGTEAELKRLIDAAHHLNLRVVFDFVANHTSIHHPFAEDRTSQGDKSPYFRYYQAVDDRAPYSSHYRFQRNHFVSYFWDDLINLNFQEPSARAMIIDACLYWVKKMDLDGYRFDAAWGFNARSPSFSLQLTRALHKRKPSLLLLAEDKGSIATPYQLGFSAAYDWAPDSAWVSHWAWEYDFSSDNSKTIFDHPDAAKRKELLQEALFSRRPDHLLFRFMENNDTRRFLAGHSLQKTKMVAALLFSLPGIPMIYNGQEIGCKLDPYKRGSIFPRTGSIQSINPSLFSFYAHLSHIRKNHPAFSSAGMNELPTSHDGVIAFLRNSGTEKMAVVLNLSDSTANTLVSLPKEINMAGRTSLMDIITDEPVDIRITEDGFCLSLPANGVRFFLLN